MAGNDTESKNATGRIDLLFPLNKAMLDKKMSSKWDTVSIAVSQKRASSDENGSITTSVASDDKADGARPNNTTNVAHKATLSQDRSQITVRGMDASKVDGTWAVLLVPK